MKKEKSKREGITNDISPFVSALSVSAWPSNLAIEYILDQILTICSLKSLFCQLLSQIVLLALSPSLGT